jgi:hypothetical protein
MDCCVFLLHAFPGSPDSLRAALVLYTPENISTSLAIQLVRELEGRIEILECWNILMFQWPRDLSSEPCHTLG